MNITDKQFEFIIKEIEITYNQIDKQRESTTDFLKIYFSIIVGFFAYIYFIENRLVINNVRITVPNSEYTIFGIFGILICLITFIIGWALLDNVTKSVYKSIKHYKHISFLRHILSSTFENDIFNKNSILLTKQYKIPMRISAQVPIIGGIFNFGLLLVNYYFFNLFLQKEYSLIACMLLICIISVAFSNQIEKHFEEIVIAQKLKPKKNENIVKEEIKKYIDKNKEDENYIKTLRIYKLSLVIFVITIILALIKIIREDLIKFNHDFIILYIPILIMLLSFIPRYYMGKHRIEKLKCF